MSFISNFTEFMSCPWNYSISSLMFTWIIHKKYFTRIAYFKIIFFTTLRDKKIAGAGLDAFAKEPPEFDLPVYKLPNVIVQPHTVAGTDGMMRKRADFAVENLKRYSDGKELEGQIFKRL